MNDTPATRHFPRASTTECVSTTVPSYSGPSAFSKKVACAQTGQPLVTERQLASDFTASQRQQTGKSLPQGAYRCIRPSSSGGMPTMDCADNDPNCLAEAFSQLKLNPDKALKRARQLKKHHLSTGQNNLSVLRNICHLEARALVQLKRHEECLTFIAGLAPALSAANRMRLTQVRALQETGRLAEAEVICRDLYDRYADTAKYIKLYGLALGRTLQVRGHPEDLKEAEVIYTVLRQRLAASPDSACKDKEVELALARLLIQIGGAANHQRALPVLREFRQHLAASRGRKEGPPYRDREIELALGILLQTIGTEENLQEALCIFLALRQRAAYGKANSPCSDKAIELALGRCYGQLGGEENLKKGLAIYTRLRCMAAGNKPDTPCNETDIEMTLARNLQQLGGKDNLQKAVVILDHLYRRLTAEKNLPFGELKPIVLSLAVTLEMTGSCENRERALALLAALRQQVLGDQVATLCGDREIELVHAIILQGAGGSENSQKALAIFTELRCQAAHGVPDTPCNDRSIELALSRCLQHKADRESQHKALAILLELRKKMADDRADTPSHDRDVELALGGLLMHMEGQENLEKALAIFIRLRALSAKKEGRVPCDNPAIEFSVAHCLTQLQRWQAFDRWNSERPRFEGSHEIERVQSIRYFNEFLMEETSRLRPRPELLKKALRHAHAAVEKSHHLDASSLSQLGHCYRAIARSLYEQETFGLQASKKQISSRAHDCFRKAGHLDPNRTSQSKDQLWRGLERAWFKQVQESPCDQSQE